MYWNRNNMHVVVDVNILSGNYWLKATLLSIIHDMSDWFVKGLYIARNIFLLCYDDDVSGEFIFVTTFIEEILFET